jgi:hypothetical protein
MDKHSFIEKHKLKAETRIAKMCEMKDRKERNSLCRLTWVDIDVAAHTLDAEQRSQQKQLRRWLRQMLSQMRHAINSDEGPRSYFSSCLVGCTHPSSYNKAKLLLILGLWTAAFEHEQRGDIHLPTKNEVSCGHDIWHTYKKDIVRYTEWLYRRYLISALDKQADFIKMACQDLAEYFEESLEHYGKPLAFYKLRFVCSNFDYIKQDLIHYSVDRALGFYPLNREY